VLLSDRKLKEHTAADTVNKNLKRQTSKINMIYLLICISLSRTSCAKIERS